MDYASLTAAAPFLKGRLHYYEETGSTNDVARALVGEGARNAVVIARRQTAGRGRLRRPFRSTSDDGLYMTMALPIQPKRQLPPTVVFACGAARALSALAGKPVLFKWVNDLLLDGFKIAGILAEGLGQTVIVGIGVNVNNDPAQFLPELPHVSSLFGCCGRRFALEAVAAAIVTAVDAAWDEPDASLHACYSAGLTTLGKDVRVVDGGRERTGHCLSLEPDGALLVRYDGGDVQRVVAGDVSVRGMQGYLP